MPRAYHAFTSSIPGQVLTKDDSGWWYVQVDGVKGWAPSTYIQLQEAAVTAPTKSLSTHSLTTKAKSKPPARPGKPPGSADSSPRIQTKVAHQRNAPAAQSRSAGSTVVSAPATPAAAVGRAVKPAIPHKPLRNIRSAVTSSSTVGSCPTDPAVSSSPLSGGGDSTEQLSVAERRQRIAAMLASR